ncbi:hypothetical protein ACIQZO_35080 [Streptomyces sp. NPDC097617]|uniref:hypothetical protein n=1 Tax=Streptomyces sp. NPDC097617 TaxID=3366091 RepID=UPI00382AD9F0
MYNVTIEHPALEEDRHFTAVGSGELRNIVWGVARAQDRPIADTDAEGREMIHQVGDLRSAADIKGEGSLLVREITVTVRPAVCETAHDGEDAVLLGSPARCDGRCQPRRRFDRNSMLDLAMALDDAGLDASGGCGVCGLEAGQMCVACGHCNCDRHDSCKRPTAAE